MRKKMPPNAPAAGGFGLDTQGVVYTDVLKALEPYLTFGPNNALQMALAQFTGGLDAAQIAQSGINSQNSANAQLGSSAISAQGGIAQQQIASQSALKSAIAGIIANYQAAQGGDQNAINQLNANFQMAAQIANNSNRQWMAEKASSGRLADNATARMFLHGAGGQAQFGSGMLGGGLQTIKPPTATFTPYSPLNLDTSMPSVQMPSFSGMGSSGGASNPYLNLPNMGDLFSGFNSQLSGLFGNFGTTPAVPATPFAGAQTTTPWSGGVPKEAPKFSPQVLAMAAAANLTPEQVMAQNPNFKWMAKGGTLRPGETGITGEYTAQPEAVTSLGAMGTKVTPLSTPLATNPLAPPQKTKAAAFGAGVQFAPPAISGVTSAPEKAAVSSAPTININVGGSGIGGQNGLVPQDTWIPGTIPANAVPPVITPPPVHVGDGQLDPFAPDPSMVPVGPEAPSNFLSPTPNAPEPPLPPKTFYGDAYGPMGQPDPRWTGPMGGQTGQNLYNQFRDAALARRQTGGPWNAPYPVTQSNQMSSNAMSTNEVVRPGDSNGRPGYVPPVTPVVPPVTPPIDTRPPNDANPYIQTMGSTTYNPAMDPSGAGKDLYWDQKWFQDLVNSVGPGWTPNNDQPATGFNANQGFALPEYGLGTIPGQTGFGNIPGIAQAAKFISGGGQGWLPQDWDWLMDALASGYSTTRDNVSALAKMFVPGSGYSKAVGY